MPPTEVRHEVRLGRASAPTCYRFPRLRRWRWDVVGFLAIADDRRAHIGGLCGYTFTRLGAARAIAKVVSDAAH